MKFLLDAHVPLRLSRALIESGHDVVRAAAKHPGWADERLLALAVRDARVIVTEDSDYSELVFRDGYDAPPSVFYLQGDATELTALVQKVLLVIESRHFADHMVVIRRDAVRYRAFPGK